MNLTSNNKHTLLNERYRPATLIDYVGNKQLKQQLRQQMSNNDIQNLLLYGTAGTGKTTLAKIIINELDCESLYINASDERGIETIRDKVVGFASVASFKPLKIVILDEADFLTIQAQASLRNVIETFSKSTRFILTCNFVERIIEPIQSRCQTIKIQPPSKPDIAKHLSNVLDKENIKYDLNQIGALVTDNYPDLRKMLNTIQASTKDNALNLDKSTLVSTSYINDVIKELAQDKPNLRNIRQIIIDANVDDYSNAYRELYDRCSEYNMDLGKIAFYISEYQYRENFRIDKEINFIAFIQDILN
jgi:replication factor C small subunit